MASCVACNGSGWNYSHTIMCASCGGTGEANSTAATVHKVDLPEYDREIDREVEDWWDRR